MQTESGKGRANDAPSSFFSEKCDDRKGGAKGTAIIIPSNRGGALLQKHIAKLESQTLQDFDIIIVYGMECDFLPTPAWASILHLRRSWDFGSAGSFCAGEMVAVTEGYRKIILADDDCLPVSDDLIAKLSSALDHRHSAKTQIHLPPRIGPMDTVFHQYGAIRSEVFEEAGYSYLPMYSGCEDLELEQRIGSRFGPPMIVDAYATHPWALPPILWGGFAYKAYHFGHGFASYRHAMGNHLGAFIDLLLRGIKASACFAIGRGDISRRYVECTAREYSMLLGTARTPWTNDRIVEIPTEYKEAPVDISSIDRVFLYRDFEGGERKYDDATETTMLSYKERKIDEKIRSMADSLRNIGKMIVFEGWFSEWDIRYALFSRRTAIGQGKDIHWVTSERSVPSIVLGAIFMAAMVPICIAAAGSLASIGMLNQILKGQTSWGYGTHRRLQRLS